MSRSRPVRSVVWMICLVTGFFILWGAYSVGAKENLDEPRTDREHGRNPQDGTRTGPPSSSPLSIRPNAGVSTTCTTRSKTTHVRTICGTC